jgi:alkylhydroperoxidase family enzyme
VAHAKAAANDAGVPDYMADLSVFQVLLRNPRVARAVNDLLASMLWHNTLDTRLRELVIMRIGWTTGSDYEWTQHWRVARSLDVSERDLLAVRDWRQDTEFGPAERAVLAATDEIVETGVMSEETWTACAAGLGGDAATLVELTVAISTWRLISSVLQTLRVPLEAGVDSWPPDGVTP